MRLKRIKLLDALQADSFSVNLVKFFTFLQKFEFLIYKSSLIQATRAVSDPLIHLCAEQFLMILTLVTVIFLLSPSIILAQPFTPLLCSQLTSLPYEGSPIVQNQCLTNSTSPLALQGTPPPSFRNTGVDFSERGSYLEGSISQLPPSFSLLLWILNPGFSSTTSLPLLSLRAIDTTLSLHTGFNYSLHYSGAQFVTLTEAQPSQFQWQLVIISIQDLVSFNLGTLTSHILRSNMTSLSSFSFPEAKTFITLGDPDLVAHLRVVHLKMVRGCLLHPYDSFDSFEQRYSPLNIPCPDLFSIATSFEKCPGNGTFHQYNSYDLTDVDSSLRQTLHFQEFQPVTQFELSFWFFLPAQFTKLQQVLLKLTKETELMVLTRREAKIHILEQNYPTKIQPHFWKEYNQISLNAFSYGSDAFQETRSTLLLSLNNQQLLEIQTYEFQVQFLFQATLELALSPAIILLSHNFAPFPRTSLLNSYQFQAKQFCAAEMNQPFPTTHSQYCSPAYSQYCNALESLPCEVNEIKEYCFGSCEVILPLVLVDQRTLFHSDRRKQFLLSFRVDAVHQYSEEIIRRHISLKFEPSQRNDFHLERTIENGSIIGFVVVHDPPIGRTENVKGTLKLLRSFYFRPKQETILKWEINKPVTLSQVIIEDSFGICCILNDPTRDMLDYAQGNKRSLLEELVRQRRYNVQSGYRVYFKYCFDVQLENPERMDEQFRVAIFFQSSPMLRVQAPTVVLTANPEDSFLPGGPSTFLESSFFSFWILAIFFDMPLKYFWGVINQVQLLQFLLLICVNKPSPLKSVLQALSFINGEFKVVESISNLYEAMLPQQFLHQTSPCQQEANVEFISALKNIEHSFWIAVIYFIFIYPLVLAFYLLFRKFKCETGLRKAAHCLSKEGLIRFFLELYADLALSFFVGLNKGQQYGRWVALEIFLRVGLFTVLIILPFHDYKKLKTLSAQNIVLQQNEERNESEETALLKKKKIKVLKERILFVAHRFCFCFLLVSLISRSSLQIGALIALEILSLLLRIYLRVYFSRTEVIFSLYGSMCFIGYLSLFGGLVSAQLKHDYGWILEYSYLMVVAILCTVAISIGFPIFSLLKDLAYTLRYG